MAIQQIRAWIVGSTDPDFLKRLRSSSFRTQHYGSAEVLKNRDIILYYHTDFDGLVIIGGYNAGLNPLFQIPSRVPLNEIQAIVPNFLKTQTLIGFQNTNDATLLTAVQWQQIRRIIIQRNQDLQSAIEQLEQAQLVHSLFSSTALVYDTARSPFQIMRPTNKFMRINTVFDDWREKVSSTPDIEPLSFVDDLLEKQLVRTPRNDDLDTFQRGMISRYAASNRETDAIDIDFRAGGEGLTPVLGALPQDVEHRMCIVEDDETNQRMMLYYAHQKGYSLTDLVSSDLIYEFKDYASIVFVQYKRLTASGRINFYDATDKSQLEQLLDTCNIQGCNNCGETTYLPSREMRMLDCPGFYKIVDHNPKVGDERKSVEGKYVQACLVHQLMKEGNTQSLKDKLLRGINMTTFFELLRTAQIGSRGASFNKLRKRIEEHMDGHLETPKSAESEIEEDFLEGHFTTYASVVG